MRGFYPEKGNFGKANLRGNVKDSIRAFEHAARPTPEVKWTPRKMAEAIVELLAARGGNE
jgi:hypothetical protein